MAQPSQPPELPYVDRPEISETFVDHVHALVFDGQTFRIDLGVTRMNDTAPPAPPVNRRYTACRRVFTPRSALELADKLGTLLKAMEAKGVIKREEVQRHDGTLQ